MPKYKKQWWKDAQQFKATLLGTADLLRLIDKCRNEEEAVTVLLLYYTGARPSELLGLKPSDVEAEGNLIRMQIPTLKGGSGRVIYLNKNELTGRILAFAQNCMVGRLLPYKRGWQIRNLVYRVSDNQLTPYFFRHNRFSIAAKEGASQYDLRYLKGAKDARSVDDYVHIAGVQTKKLAKVMSK